MRWFLAPLAALALLVSACGDDTSSSASLDDGAEAVDLGSDPVGDDVPGDTATGDTATADADDTADGDDAGTDDVATDDTDGADDGTDAAGTQDPADDAPADASADGVTDVRRDHPVEARPGSWAVADAGEVEFDLTDAGLVLLEVREADGWTARVDEDDDDEIEVDFRRGDTDHELEIEWDGNTLEIDLDTDIDPAEPGVYELGPAGSFEWTRDGGRIDLVDVIVAEGWELRMQDESSDEIEFQLTNGDERWRVEIELDDGRVELEIDHRVRSTPTR